MSTRQCSLMVILSVVAGLLGGVVSSQFLMRQPVFAEEVGEKSKEIFPEFKVIMAREINLLGLDRKPRIRLMVDQNGQPGLHFYDEKGKYWAGFSVGAGTPALTMRDKSGLRLQIGLTSLTSIKEEYPTILMMDKRGVERAVLALDIEGRPRVTLKDENGKVIWQAP